MYAVLIYLFNLIVAFEVMLVRDVIRFGVHRHGLSRDILKYVVGISVDTISLTNPQQYKPSHVFKPLFLTQKPVHIHALSCS